jgi:hypothetical protein
VIYFNSSAKKYSDKEARKNSVLKEAMFIRERNSSVVDYSRRINLGLNEFILKQKDFDIPNDLRAVRWDRIKILILLSLALIIDSLIEGNNKIPSFLGIPKYDILI